MERSSVVNFASTKKVYKFIKPKQKRCVLCLDVSESNISLCRACIKDLPYNVNSCDVCSKPLNKAFICGDCSISSKKHITKILSVFKYQYPINRLLLSLKFNHGLTDGHVLGHLMGDFIWNELNKNIKPDWLIPVPLNYQRLMSRGYNQSYCLAKPIADELGLTIKQDVCIRVKNTKNQTALNANLRRQNIHNAFQINKEVKGKHIVLIDDVITTGSTLNELAKTFKKAGAASVQAWCCAIRVD